MSGFVNSSEEHKQEIEASAFENIFLVDPSHNPEASGFSEAPPCVSMDKDNFVETITLYKLELDNDAHFSETAKILYTVLNNVATNPEEKKYQKLRLSNEKIQKYVAG